MVEDVLLIMRCNLISSQTIPNPGVFGQSRVDNLGESLCILVPLLLNSG
jgi:hypothetical protein